MFKKNKLFKDKLLSFFTRFQELTAENPEEEGHGDYMVFGNKDDEPIIKESSL